MKWFYVLNSTNRAHVTRSIAEAIRTAPEGYILRLTEPNRSLAQNSMIHGLMTEVGRMIDWRWCDQEVGVDELKMIFMAAYRKIKGQEVRLIKGIDGQPVNLDYHTSGMTKRECSEFTELTHAWMAEYRRHHDVVLERYK